MPPADRPTRGSRAQDTLAPGDGRLPTRVVLIGLAIGLVLGALVGALVGLGATASYQATTIASVQPDDAVTAAQLDGSSASTDTSDFIQGELVVITSRDVRAQVQQQLGLTSLPTVSASQSGTTDIVDITASASSSAQAVRIANATRNVYAERRAQELTNDITDAQAQVTAQIAAVRQQIAANPGSENSASGLQQQYARLLAESSDLALDSAQSTQAVTTIQQATVAAGGLSAVDTDALGGAVVGVLLAALGLVALRRTRPLVRSVDDLAGYGPDVLVPAFPRNAADARRTARLLASRLRGGSPHRGGVVVLIGSRRRSGTTHVAAALAATYAAQAHVLFIPSPGREAEALPASLAGAQPVTLAELGGRRITPMTLATLAGHRGAPQTRVLTVSAQDLRNISSTELLGAAARVGWFVVADMPPLTDSDIGLVVARAAGSATLVVGQSLTQPVDVVSAVDILEGCGVTRLSLLLNQVPLRRAGRRAAPAPSPVGDGSSARAAVTPDFLPSAQAEAEAEAEASEAAPRPVPRTRSPRATSAAATPRPTATASASSAPELAIRDGAESSMADLRSRP
jgi:capsular polysaccharide biosynthesis protein